MIQTTSDQHLVTDPPVRDEKKKDRQPDAESEVIDYGVVQAHGECADRSSSRRRTPRVSVIVVLSENHFVSPDSLARELRQRGDQEVDVLVACAGQPPNLNALQRSVGDAQFLLAPAGTSIEDLRELAMGEATGDIVTLLSAAILHESTANGQQLSRTS